MGDVMINGVPNIQPSTAMPSAFPAVQKGPGKFARIFGGILGGALNLVAPGAGSLIGNFIGGAGRGNSWNGGSIGGILGGIGGGPDFYNMQSMIENSGRQQMAMINIQNQVQTQTQEFTTITNLLKARHDGQMSAVHNFKS